MYNQLEFLNNLSYNESVDLLHLIREAEAASELKIVKRNASLAFSIVAPKVPEKLLFSSEKNFANLPYMIHDVQRGIHVVRMIFAQIAHEKSFDGKIRSQDLVDDGIVVLTDVLLQRDCERLLEEMRKFPLATSKNSTNLITSNLNNPVIHSAYREINSQLAAVMGGDYPMFFQNAFIQRLENRVGDGDVQKYLHSDTFFPAYKFWYFPHDVYREDGPFSYVPKSNRLTKPLLEWYYRQSIEVVSGNDAGRTYGHAEGSFRIFEDELESLGLKEVPASVPGDTLVIANVLGFHRRSEVKTVGYRDAIHSSYRRNPLE